MGALSEKVDISEVTQGGSNNTQQVAKTIINNYGTTPFNESKKLRANNCPMTKVTDKHTINIRYSS